MLVKHPTLNQHWINVLCLLGIFWLANTDVRTIYSDVYSIAAKIGPYAPPPPPTIKTNCQNQF